MKLGDIADIQIGRTPSRSNPEYWGDGYDWLSIADLSELKEGKYTNQSAEQVTEIAIQKGMKAVPVGTLLYSFKLSIGKVAITSKPSYTNEAIASILIKPGKKHEVSINYLFYALKFVNVSKLVDHAAKGKTLNKAKLLEIEIEIPNISIQEQIVVKLDRIYSIIEKRKTITKLLDNLAYSILNSICGDSHLNPNNYPEKPLKDLVYDNKIITYGIVQAGPNVENGVYYIRSGDIKNGKILTEQLSKTSPEIASNYERSRCVAGDIVMSIRATVGSCAIVPLELEGINLTQGTARISIDEQKVSPYYMYYALTSKGIHFRINKQIKGSTFKEITLAKLRQVMVPIPSISEQNDFKFKCSPIEALKKKYEKSIKQLELLLNSVIHGAFLNTISKSTVFEDIIVDNFKSSLLINQLQDRDFETIQQYDDSKQLLYKFLNTTESDVVQFYDNEKQEVKIGKSNEINSPQN